MSLKSSTICVGKPIVAVDRNRSANPTTRLRTVQQE